jgi:PAS domain S-box-containing protein
LVGLLHEGIWAIDAEAHTTFVNERMAEMLGYTVEEMQGRSLLDFIDPEDRDVVRCRLIEREQGQAEQHEFSFPTKHGGRVDVLMQTAPVFDERGKYAGAVAGVLDITERKRAEEACRVSEEQFRLAFEHSPGAMALMSLDGRFIRTNRAVTDLLGYTFAELRHKTFSDVTHVDDIARCNSEYQAFLKSNRENYTTEKRYVHKKGHVVRAILSVVLVRDHDGQPLYNIAQVQDVTHQREADRAVQGQKELLGYIIRHDPNAIAVYDNDLRYIFVSERYLNDYGVTDKQVIGKHHYDVFPEMPQRWKDVHQRVLRGAVESAEEDHFDRLDGSVDYNRWECRPWYRGDGSIGGMITYTEVITERKKAELALRQSEYEKSLILNSTSELFVYYDLELNILWANRAAGESVGKRAEDLVGQHCYELWHGRDEPCENCPVIKAMRTREPQQAEVTSPHGRHWHLRGYPVLDDQGDVVALVEYGQDITERKKAEMALLESEARFRTVFEAGTDGILIADPHTRRFHLANPAMCDMLGYSLEEITRLGIEDIHPAEALPTVQECFDRITRGDLNIARELPVLRKDGVQLLVEISAASIVVDGKHLTAGFFHDLTERKNTEIALRDSERRYRILSESISDYVYVIDVPPEGKFNRADLILGNFEAIVGYTPEELAQLPDGWLSVVHPDDRPVLERMLTDELRNRETAGEYRIRAKSGDVRWLSDRARPIWSDTEQRVVEVYGGVSDITERKRAEEKTRYYLNLLESVIKQAPFAAHILTGDFSNASMLIENDESKRLLGEALTALESLDLGSSRTLQARFFTPDGAREVPLSQMPSPRAMKGEIVRNEEYLFRHPDGTEYYINASASPVRDEAGEILAVAVTFPDITDRVKMELALRESEQTFRSLFEKSPDAHVLYAEEGYLDCNQATVELLGLSCKEDLLSLQPEDISPEFQPDGRRSDEKAREMIETAYARGSHVFEWTLRCADGRDVYLDVLLNAITLKGRPAIHSVWRNITERKRAEEALRDSEERFRSFVENAGDIVYALTPEGVFTYVSPNWLELMGEPAETAIGRSFEPYVHPEDRQVCRDFLEQVLRTGENQTSVEYRGLHRDGSFRWHVSKGAALCDKDGKVVSYVGIARDVTDKKKTEEELERYREHLEDLVDQRTRELEASQSQLRRSERLASLGTLAAGIAHEINNPVGAILLTSQIAERFADLPEPVKSTLDQIIEHARRCEAIVHNIQQFAQSHDSTKIWANLDVAVTQAVELTGRYLTPGQRDVQVDLAGDLPDLLLNKTGIEQLMINLIRNAFEAGATRVGIKTQMQAGNVVLTVTDNGPGIAEQDHSRVFDPFFTTRQARGGTGLGLSIVHNIVQDHDATIRLEQPADGGTRFVVHFAILASSAEGADP